MIKKTIIPFLLLLSINGLLLAQTQEAMQKYRQISKLKDPVKRIEALQQLVKDYPDESIKIRAYNSILRTYLFEIKDINKAESLAQKIIKTKDVSLKQIGYSSLLYIYKQSNPDKFENYARSILKTENDPAILTIVYSELGEYYSKTDLAKLEKLGDEVIQAPLINGMLFYNWAQSLIEDNVQPQLGLKLALHGKTLMTLENINKLYPDMSEDNAKYRLNMGKTYINDLIGWGYFKTGDYKNAVSTLRETKEHLDQPNAEVNLHLGAALVKTGKTDEGIDLLIRALIEQDSKEGLQFLADALGKNKSETEDYLLEKRFELAKNAENFTLNDIKGNQHTLSDYLGNVVIINFFSPT